MMRAAIGASFIAMLACTGCGGESEMDIQSATRGPWLNLFDWTETTTGDPFAALREEQVACTSDAFEAEEIGGVFAFSVDTGQCGWLTVEQASLLDVYPGDIIRANIWHFELLAPAPATGRVGLAINDDILQLDTVNIPSPSGLLRLEFTIQSAIPAGTKVYFHVDNHGANSWHLLGVTVNPMDPSPTD